MVAANPFPDGFVTLEQAERLRQDNEAGAFRAKNPAEWERLTAAIVAYKNAATEWQAARIAVGNATTSNVNDLVDAAEREAGAQLAETAKQLSVRKLEQADKLKKSKK
jgi:hypothetical protein